MYFRMILSKRLWNFKTILDKKTLIFEKSIPQKSCTLKQQGRIHGNPSRVRVGRGSDEIDQAEGQEQLPKNCQ